MKKVEELHKKKASVVVVAVSEGVKLADGRYVCELTDGIEFVDAFGRQAAYRHGQVPGRKINREVGCKTRAIEFNSYSAAPPILCQGWILQKPSR